MSKIEIPCGILKYDSRTKQVKSDPRRGKIVF